MIPSRVGRVGAALTAAVMVLALFAGCPSAAQRLAIKECQFTVRDVQVHGYGPLEVELLVVLGVHNPNDIEVIVDTMDYTAYLNGRKLASGHTVDDVSIPAFADGDLPITMRMNLLDLGMAAATLLRSNDRLIKIRATYYVMLPWGRQPFPVEVERKV